MDKVLFINSSISACGVHQYGFNIAHTIIKHSKVYEYEYKECNSEREFANAFTAQPYVAVIYNYHPSTIGWATQSLEKRYPHVPHIGIVHEPGWYGAPFKFKVSQDPTSKEEPPYFKQYSRNIFDYENTYPDPEVRLSFCRNAALKPQPYRHNRYFALQHSACIYDRRPFPVYL